MGSSHSNRHSRLSWAVGASLALATGMSTSTLADSVKADSAKADSPKAAPSVANPSGIMTFEHVRVVNAPIAVQAQASQGKSEGIRAYVDPNKRLRGQTLDEARQVASERKVRVKSARAPMARSASANAVESSDGSQTLYGPNGEQGMLLDEDSMVYQLAHKDSSGVVGQQCVTGHDHALDALHSGVMHKGQSEVRHDR